MAISTFDGKKGRKQEAPEIITTMCEERDSFVLVIGFAADIFLQV